MTLLGICSPKVDLVLFHVIGCVQLEAPLKKVTSYKIIILRVQSTTKVHIFTVTEWQMTEWQTIFRNLKCLRNLLRSHNPPVGHFAKRQCDLIGLWLLMAWYRLVLRQSNGHVRVSFSYWTDVGKVNSQKRQNKTDISHRLAAIEWAIIVNQRFQLGCHGNLNSLPLVMKWWTTDRSWLWSAMAMVNP